jgi:hypothetical protein
VRAKEPAPLSPRRTRNTATVFCRRPSATAGATRFGVVTAASERRSGAGSGGNISDAAPRLGPVRPARSNLIRVLGQQDVTRTRSPRSRVRVRLVRFPSSNQACARNRWESEKGVAGQEQRRGGHSDAALLLGGRRTQAGAIIRTAVSEMSSRVTAPVGLFRGQAPHPILEFFGTPWAIWMGPIGGKHRSVRVGTPATHSGATCRVGGNRGRWPAHPTHTPTCPPARYRLPVNRGAISPLSDPNPNGPTAAVCGGNIGGNRPVAALKVALRLEVGRMPLPLPTCLGLSQSVRKTSLEQLTREISGLACPGLGEA